MTDSSPTPSASDSARSVTRHQARSLCAGTALPLQLGNRTADAAMDSTRENGGVLPIVGIRPLSGRTGTTLLMSLLGTSPSIAFDRRYPAEYRIGSYLARMAAQMTEAFDERTHVGVTDFFFGPQPSWGPLPFQSDALDIEAWRPELLRAMWASVSDAVLAARPDARWYAEKLAVDEGALRAAGVEVFTIDLVRDPRDVLASRRSFLAGGTDHWARDAGRFADELSPRLDELDAQPPVFGCATRTSPSTSTPQPRCSASTSRLSLSHPTLIARRSTSRRPLRQRASDGGEVISTTTTQRS